MKPQCNHKLQSQLQNQSGIQPLTMSSARFNENAARHWTDLDVGKVDAVEVGQHLIDLSRVLEDSTGCLGQVVQTGVAAQGLSKSIGWCDLREEEDDGSEKDAYQYFHKYPYITDVFCDSCSHLLSFIYVDGTSFFPSSQKLHRRAFI